MNEPRQDESIGKYWVIAMVVLLALLVLGFVLYMRMSATLTEPGKHAAVGAATQCLGRISAPARMGNRGICVPAYRQM